MAAVIGSRKCSEYGKQTAMAAGKALGAAGACVVSGMAKGIDSFGHLGALKNGGKTIAVLGCGVDICYPAENRKLYEQICREGLVISEAPLGLFFLLICWRLPGVLAHRQPLREQ